MSKEWKFIGRPKGEHHWFTDRATEKELAVADDSVRENFGYERDGILDPSRAEDGLLTVSHTRPTTIHVDDDGKIGIRVPIVRKPDGLDDGFVGGGICEANFIIPVLSKRGFEIRLHPSLKILKEKLAYVES